MTARFRRPSTSRHTQSSRTRSDQPLAASASRKRHTAINRSALLQLRLRLLALLALVTVGIVSRFRYFDYCMHDDAFISFRYARNLIRGEGLVMNPGERVEGFTNFLWTVLVAPAMQLGLDPEWFTQIVGSLLALVLVVGVFWFAEKRLESGWFSLVAPVFLIGNLAFVMESLSGLESMAFAVLAFLTTVVFLEERQRPQGLRGAWAALAAAATLVRPEGGILFGILASYALLGVLRGEPLRPLLRSLGIFSMLLLPFVVFRLAYYGTLFPNTFYVKVGYTAAQLARGWRYTVHVLAYSLTPALLLASLAGVLLTAATPGNAFSDRDTRLPQPGWRRLFPADARREAIAVISFVCIVHILYVLAVGGDYEPTARFYMPILAWIYLLAQETGRTFFLLGRRRGPRLALASALLASLLLGWGLFESEKRFILLLGSRGWPLSRWQHHQELKAVGDWLRFHTAEGTTIALSSIGALPWYADRPILDMMGLTDAHIGRLQMERMGQGPAGHEKGDGSYVLQRRPQIILLDRGHLFDHEASTEEIRNGARGISELEVLQAPQFAQLYELRRAQTTAGILHWFQLRETTPAQTTPAR